MVDVLTFMSDIEALCQKHGVSMIATEGGQIGVCSGFLGHATIGPFAFHHYSRPEIVADYDSGISDG